ncbi:hypothetical protein DPMN_002988 [Dreissena polymorpha]|uniref:Uncharacterized protein n=1 Tax=Dreissena polymorpha TaxID=45954 RepID=A0A9D4MPS1_DREPO|nr:hypothetical protein DPMN_002988 [Dreissena polymorpha]
MPRHPHGSGFLLVTPTSDTLKYSFFPRSIYHFGPTYQHPLLRPPLWHPSKVGYPA